MKIVLHRNFKKSYKKLRQSEKERFKQRRNIFLKNPFHPILNNHALHGKYEKFRSINVGGSLRALYEPVSENVALFITIDTHDKLYR
jgi:addiction module RelE/StbE family toxin